MGSFKYRCGDWVEYRKLPGLMECDFHHSGNDSLGNFYLNMDSVYKDALRLLKIAQEQGKQYILFTHGWSTSGRGRTSSRSQIRKLMRSKFATPYIERGACIQHPSVFVVAVRPKSSE